MTVFIQYLVNGLSMGSVYAIIALGYTMVYGIAKMLNFAHGDVVMVGAYVSFCATSYLGLPGWASVILSCVVCTVLGVLIEGLAYKPLRQAGPLAVLITAIGVSYFLQNAAQLLWGATPKNFTSLVAFPVPEFLAKLNVSAVSLVTIVACLVIMAGLMFFTGKTKMGKAMRAVSEDKAAAQLMGINVNRTISMTFAIGSALAAIAGVLLCSYSPVLQPTTGAMPGIKAFDAAVFGGIGSIPGAFVGGILIGIIEAMAQAYISTSLANSIVFGVLIIVLLVKPAVQVNEGVILICSFIAFQINAGVHDVNKLPERHAESAQIALPVIFLHDEKLRHKPAECGGRGVGRAVSAILDLLKLCHRLLYDSALARIFDAYLFV